MTDEWQTIPEAARTLGKSERTIYRWAAAGRIPVDRSVTPTVVNVGNVGAGTPMAARVADRELEGLRAELARKDERIRELTAERDYLRLLAGTLATGQQKAIEASRPVHRWRWPWQKEREP